MSTWVNPGTRRRSWKPIFWGLVALLASLTKAHCGVARLAPEVDAHLFFLKQNEAMVTVIGADRNGRLKVRLPSRETEFVRFSRVRYVEKKLPSVARLTVCETEGSIEWQQFVNGDVLQTLGQTEVYFELVADRDIPDCYVVLFFTFPDQPDNKVLDFSEIGHLPRGELVRKTVLFPNVFVPEGTSYKFEFYSNGFPIETFRLRGVAPNPRSQSLLIPWDLRIKQFKNFAKAKKLNSNPRPFERGFIALDIPALKDRGIEEIKVSILVKNDGYAEIIEGDPRLSPRELSSLSLDVQTWHFFPAVKNGKLISRKVSFPIRF